MTFSNRSIPDQPGYLLVKVMEDRLYRWECLHPTHSGRSVHGQWTSLLATAERSAGTHRRNNHDRRF